MTKIRRQLWGSVESLTEEGEVLKGSRLPVKEPNRRNLVVWVGYEKSWVFVSFCNFRLVEQVLGSGGKHELGKSLKRKQVTEEDFSPQMEIFLLPHFLNLSYA